MRWEIRSYADILDPVWIEIGILAFSTVSTDNVIFEYQHEEQR